MPSPWLTFRQVREALRAGQPDEARRLVEPLAAAGYRKAVRLTREVARSYLARADKHLRADHPDAAWRELLAAESLNTGEGEAARLRTTLTRLGLAECRAALEVGHPVLALDAVARLRDYRSVSPELDPLATAASDWLTAAGQADRGDFLLAKVTATRVRDRLDPTTGAGVARFLADLEQRALRCREGVGRLHAAADARQWEDAIRWADEVVAVAPNHREARDLRAQAWDALRPDAAVEVADFEPVVPLAVASPGEEFASQRVMSAVRVSAPVLAPTRRAGGSLPSQTNHVQDTPDDTRPLPKRFRLWVDGVGGYLVCLSPRVTFGQATSEGPVDVPLFADVSRLHAELTRDAEGYVLESGREVQVNGRPVKRTALACGDRITLGSTCQFVFRKPVPISPTARLELVSGHRLPMAVDGVLLMAESLILGREGRVHVAMPDEVPGTVVLYRSKDGLGVRFDGPFTVDGRPCQGRSPLPLPAVVSAEAFSFAVEPVGPRL